MTEQRVSLRYARAVFDTAKKTGFVDTVYNDFNIISSYFKVSRDLIVFLKSPVIQGWKKKQLLKELFSGKINELTFNFIILVTEKQRENFLPDIIAVYERLYFKEKNIVKAEITTSRELDENMKLKIKNELESKLIKTIIPSFKIDADLKGGITIRVDDWVYDASVRNQLIQLRNTLIEGKLV
ncbi:ATP synthase F1 subunit delta [Candidatus Kapaibacterium sp.]